MSSVPDGRAANQPLAANTLSPPIGAPLPGARVSLSVIGSPPSRASFTESGESRASRVFSAGVAAASMRVYHGVPSSAVSSRYRSPGSRPRSEEHTSELQSQSNLVCRLLLEKKKKKKKTLSHMKKKKQKRKQR